MACRGTFCVYILGFITMKISTSILAANYAILGDEIRKLCQAGSDYLHFDIMDGNFVQNISFGSDVIKSLRPYGNAVFDVHLMVNNPDRFIADFVAAGSDIITVHAEAIHDARSTLAHIKTSGAKAGIAISPQTHPATIDGLYDIADLILVMTVNPGAGGQQFMHSQINKLEYISSVASSYGRHIDISVDGGINAETAKIAQYSGANVIVAGSYIFRNQDYQHNIQSLRYCSA